MDRLAMTFAAHEETQAILARSRMYMAREDLVDLLAARCAQLELDVPAATLARAHELLSPRAQAGLAALPAEQRAVTAYAVATGAGLTEWDRHLSQGQPWPDVIEYQP